MNTRRANSYGTRQRGLFDSMPLVPVIVVAFGVGGIATYALQGTGVGDWFAEPAVVASYEVSHLSTCGSGKRITCVVDGDTFWLEGTKIRIADINTPEINSPECAAEAALGRQATARLSELLNDGPFDLVSIDRDEDQYGRKLRIVERDGRSLGDTLVAEGLAHEWRGRREGWC